MTSDMILLGVLCGLAFVCLGNSYWIGRLEVRLAVYRDLIVDCRVTIEQTWLLLKDSEEKRLKAEDEREKLRAQAKYMEKLNNEQA